MKKELPNSYTWKNLENLKGDGVGGAFAAELWSPFDASLDILVQFLKIMKIKKKSIHHKFYKQPRNKTLHNPHIHK